MSLLYHVRTSARGTCRTLRCWRCRCRRGWWAYRSGCFVAFPHG